MELQVHWHFFLLTWDMLKAALKFMSCNLKGKISKNLTIATKAVLHEFCGHYYSKQQIELVNLRLFTYVYFKSKDL